MNGANKTLRLGTTTLSDMTVIGGKSDLPQVAASMYRDLCWMLEDRWAKKGAMSSFTLGQSRECIRLRKGRFTQGFRHVQPEDSRPGGCCKGEDALLQGVEALPTELLPIGFPGWKPDQ